MNDERPSLEERLIELMGNYDDALAAGATSLPGTNPAAELPPRLQKDLAYLQFLRQVLSPRPGAGSGPTDSPASVDTPPPGVTSLPQGSPALTLPYVSAGTSAETPFSSIGRFQIRRELGRGGCGVVFLAHDPSLNRDVALKVPRAEALGSPEFRARFQREARATAAFDHPNLVPVHEVGEVGPLCYIVAAYIPGISLAEWLKRQTDPVPPRDAALVVHTLAQAVDHAHARGVVHRDLKPGNVLMQDPTQEEGANQAPAHSLPVSAYQPKITDFGLAKLLEQEAPGQETQSGAILGTPQYMAPEQASGKNKEIGPTADVYALGVILYELLTGRPPFQGDTPMDTLLQVQSAELLPPTRLRPKLPRDLETICLHCLHKDSRKRYVSAQELADDLGRFLNGEAIRARPVGRAERLWKWARRRPATAGLITVSAIALLVAIGLGVVYLDNIQNRAKAVTDLAEADSKLAGINRQREEAERSLEPLRSERDNLQTESGNLKGDVAKAHKEIASLEKRIPELDKKVDWSRRSLVASTLLRFNDADPVASLALLQDPNLCPEELRDFGWHLLHRLAKRDQPPLVGANGPIWQVAVSPDGKTLASGSGFDSSKKPGGEARLWSIATGKTRAILTGHSGPVKQVVFSPDGKTLASLGRTASKGEVKLWNVDTAKELCTLAGKQGYPTDVNFTADGQTVAIVRQIKSKVYEVTLWETASGKQIAERQVDNDRCEPTLTRDAKLLAVAKLRNPSPLDYTSADVHIYAFPDVAKPVHILPQDHISSMAFAPSGKLLATGGMRVVKLWDLDPKKSGAEKLLREFSVPGHNTEIVSWSPDGKFLIVRSGSNTAIFEAGTFREVFQFDGGATFSADGTLLAISTFSTFAGLRLWDLSGARPREREFLAGVNGWLYLAADGKTVFTISGRSDETAPAIGVWRIGVTREPELMPGPGPVHFGRINQHGKVVEMIAPKEDAAPTGVKVWDLFTGRLIGDLPEVVRVAGLSPDGNTLIARQPDRAGMTGELELWDVPSSKRLAFLGDAAERVVFAANSKAFATLTRTTPLAKGGVRLWDVATASQLLFLPGKGGAPDPCFSPDGKTFASAINPVQTYGGGKPSPFTGKSLGEIKTGKAKPLPLDPELPGEVVLIEVATGKIRGTLTGFKGHVRTLGFLADGALATPGHATPVWDVATLKGAAWEELAKPLTLLPPEDEPWFRAVSPDGKTVATLPTHVKPGVPVELKLIDPVTGQERLRLPVGRSGGSPLFSPDGRTLFVISEGKVKHWSIESPATGR